MEVDTFSEHIGDGDTLLLCSDGLWEMLPKVKVIENVLCSPLMSVEQMVERPNCTGEAVGSSRSPSGSFTAVFSRPMVAM